MASNRWMCVTARSGGRGLFGVAGYGAIGGAVRRNDREWTAPVSGSPYTDRGSGR